MLTERRIWGHLAGLDTGIFGTNVHFYPEVGSTNDVAKDLAAQHAPEGTVVLADFQLAGRGRLGRSWMAPPGSSLLTSVLFRPELHVERIHRLVMVVALAMADACRDVAGVQIDVKWPNDLLIGGRKVAGILPESAIQGNRAAWVIVGIGVNVNQHFEEGHPLAHLAISLCEAAGHDINRVNLFGRFLVHLNHWHQHLPDDSLHAAWRSRCTTLGQQVEISLPHGSVRGEAADIDGDGALWVRTDAGLRRIVAGEATIVPR